MTIFLNTRISFKLEDVSLNGKIYIQKSGNKIVTKVKIIPLQDVTRLSRGYKVLKGKVN